MDETMLPLAGSKVFIRSLDDVKALASRVGFNDLLRVATDASLFTDIRNIAKTEILRRLIFVTSHLEHEDDSYPPTAIAEEIVEKWKLGPAFARGLDMLVTIGGPGLFTEEHLRGLSGMDKLKEEIMAVIHSEEIPMKSVTAPKDSRNMTIEEFEEILKTRGIAGADSKGTSVYVHGPHGGIQMIQLNDERREVLERLGLLGELKEAIRKASPQISPPSAIVPVKEPVKKKSVPLGKPDWLPRTYRMYPWMLHLNSTMLSPALMSRYHAARERGGGQLVARLPRTFAPLSETEIGIEKLRLNLPLGATVRISDDKKSVFVSIPGKEGEIPMDIAELAHGVPKMEPPKSKSERKSSSQAKPMESTVDAGKSRVVGDKLWGDKELAELLLSERKESDDPEASLLHHDKQPKQEEGGMVDAITQGVRSFWGWLSSPGETKEKTKPPKPPQPTPTHHGLLGREDSAIFGDSVLEEVAHGVSEKVDGIRKDLEQISQSVDRFESPFTDETSQMLRRLGIDEDAKWLEIRETRKNKISKQLDDLKTKMKDLPKTKVVDELERQRSTMKVKIDGADKGGNLGDRGTLKEVPIEDSLAYLRQTGSREAVPGTEEFMISEAGRLKPKSVIGRGNLPGSTSTIHTFRALKMPAGGSSIPGGGAKRPSNRPVPFRGSTTPKPNISFPQTIGAGATTVGFQIAKHASKALQKGGHR